MLKKIAFVAVGIALFASPMFVAADQIALPAFPANPTIQDLQDEIRLLVQILNQLLSLRGLPPVPPSSPAFTASPTSGAAPLAVQFNMNNGVVANPIVDFGDGTSGPALNFGIAASKSQDTLGHTYTIAGTYTAKFESASGNVLATQVITVTGPGTSSPNIAVGTKDGYSFDVPFDWSVIVSNSPGDANLCALLVSDATGAATGVQAFGGQGCYAVSGNATEHFTGTLSSQNGTLVPGQYHLHLTLIRDTAHYDGVAATYAQRDSVSFTVTGSNPVQPTASIWAVPTSVAVGSQSSIFWNSTGATSCSETSSDGSFSHNTISGGAATGALSGTMTYIITCTAANGQSVSNSALVTAITATPSATIDQSSLTSTSPNPTITGSATNVNSVTLALKGYTGGTSPVVNGRWSITIVSALPSGTYGLQLSNNADNTVLVNAANATLTVTVGSSRVQCPSYMPLSCYAGQHAVYGPSTTDSNGCYVPDKGQCVPDTNGTFSAVLSVVSSASPALARNGLDTVTLKWDVSNFPTGASLDISLSSGSSSVPLVSRFPLTDTTGVIDLQTQIQSVPAHGTINWIPNYGSGLLPISGPAIVRVWSSSGDLLGSATAPLSVVALSTASASDKNANLANALTALESALKAMLVKLGQ